MVSLQSTYISILIPKVCIYKCPQLPKTPTLGQSPSHHHHEQEKKTQQEFEIQNPTSVQWPIPIHNAL